MTYADFLDSKKIAPPRSGIEPDDGHTSLYPFQRAIVRWAVRRGRAAIFADCGLGKTRMQLDWARQIGKRTLIVAPLAVAEQSIAEAHEIGLVVKYCTKTPVAPGIWITNYERIHSIDPDALDSIVLDESSILKSIDGKTRTRLIRDFRLVPYRLCCTATPAPNDISELGNHADFLGIMTQAEMLASFFVNDSMSSGYRNWRLKGHAADAFWKWLVSWAVVMRKPSDLGFEDGPFILPELRTDERVSASEWKPEGMLFNIGTPAGLDGRRAARRASIAERCVLLELMILAEPGHWLVWHDLNDEGRALRDLLGKDCVLIEGKDSPESRLEKHARWISGQSRVLITKPSIFGWGMNWQHCSRVAFLGLGDSFEQWYQAVRRCWRFGQTKSVAVSVITSSAEVGIVENVRRKEREAERLMGGIMAHTRDLEMAELRDRVKPREHKKTEEFAGVGWKILQGDSFEFMADVDPGSIGLSVFSPPFASLYTYSASEHDLGNSSNYEQFFQHLAFLPPLLLRATMQGRRACVHCQQVSLRKTTDNVIGLRDFRADMVRCFAEHGWIYDGEVVIDKDPQAQAIRTKSKALTFMQKNKDSLWSRPALADYILLFRAPGENPEPVTTDVSNEEWIAWARPIWYGIRETETLNVALARSNKDERHICPLQLETIARCLRLWSNRGDLIFDPFCGIGSTGFEALKLGRQFLGFELKPEYVACARSNLRAAESMAIPLFPAIKEST